MTDTDSGAALSYRVTELTEVSDQSIEEALNRGGSEGYRFESIHFVVQPGNRRPTMAFLFFTRMQERERE
ncbi:MAG: hypothetical protein FWF95_00940 [Syntrophorhabdaceae bacterium]|nr:hypothetical protein [Syntrophorhabdaceae bacterium]